MKKIILFCLFVILLASFVSSFTPNSTLFADDFNRANSATVGNGWVETEGAGTSAAISGNTLLLTDNSNTNSVNVVHTIGGTGWENFEYQAKISTGNTPVLATQIRTSTNTLLTGTYLRYDTVDGRFEINYFDGATFQEVLAPISENTYYTIFINDTDFTGGTYDIYVDGTKRVDDASMANTGVPNNVFYGTAGSANAFTTNINYVAFYNITEKTPQFELTASNIYNSSSITVFNATFSNSTDMETISTTNGTIYWNAGDTINISIFNASNYFNRSYINYDTYTNLNAELTPFFYSHNETFYSNYTLYSSTNYVRKLNYDFNVTCRTGTTTNLSIYINDTYAASELLTCYNNKHEYSGSYQHDVEGNQSFYFHIFNEDGNETFGENTFLWDLNNPNTTINFTNVGLFSLLANITQVCTDSVIPILTYNMTFNNVLIDFANYSNGTILNKTKEFNNGENMAVGTCYDFFGSTTDTYDLSIFSKEIRLIDEITAGNFDSSNITNSRLYYLDESFYDFKAEGTSAVNVSIVNNSKFRLYFEYPDSIVINRYFDISLFDESSVRVCANKDNVVHVEQLIISGTEKPVKIKSDFANCYVVGDYTRFAYADSLSILAYTISTIYTLYAYDDNSNEIVLAYIDGGIQSSTGINLDVLEFNQNAFSVKFNNQGLGFFGFNNQTVGIYYENIKEDNTNFAFEITDLESGDVLLTYTPTNPNKWLIYFDYSTFDINTSTIFKFKGTATTEDEQVEIVRYFTPKGKASRLGGTLGLVLWFVLLFFGLSIFAAGSIFSWIGFFVLILGQGILGVTVQTPYVIFAEAVNISLLLFVGIMITKMKPDFTGGA